MRKDLRNAGSHNQIAMKMARRLIFIESLNIHPFDVCYSN